MKAPAKTNQRLWVAVLCSASPRRAASVCKFGPNLQDHGRYRSNSRKAFRSSCVGEPVRAKGNRSCFGGGVQRDVAPDFPQVVTAAFQTSPAIAEHDYVDCCAPTADLHADSRRLPHSTHCSHSLVLTATAADAPSRTLQASIDSLYKRSPRSCNASRWSLPSGRPRWILKRGCAG